MSTENIDTNDGTNGIALDDFAAELFGDGETAPDNAKSEETDGDDTEVNGETEEDTQTDDLEVVSEDDDTLAQDEDEEPTDDATDVDPKPKKKNRFQERIDELTAARKEAERERDELAANFQQQLDEMKAKLEGNKDGQTKDKPEGVGSELVAPNKDDKNEDGTPKYPLGEYDPKFMRDTVEHMFAEREAKAQQEQTLTAEQRQRMEAEAALQGEWNNKLVDARERYPDFQQKGEQMLAVFEGIDEQYGDYLTTTLMEMDNGPDVFYYLANNVEEAQAIVNAGPKKATMALAKLEAQLGGQPSTPRQKVTKAKTPPPQNKGSSVANSGVVKDLNQPGGLAALERELFSKKS